MATRVTLPASRFAPEQEARHGQPSVIADVRKNMTIAFPCPVDRQVKLFIIGLSIFSILSFGWVYVLSIQDQAAIRYIDIPLHVIGGAIAGIGYILLVAWTIPYPVLSGVPRWHLMLSTISFVSLVAVLWEFFELFTDAFLHTGLQDSLAETLKDVAVGLVGGLSSTFCWPPTSAWKQK